MPQHPQYVLLISEYDNEHRAHLTADDGVGRQLARICNEADDVLMVPEGSERSFQHMRNFVEMVRRRCRQMTTRMNRATAAGHVVQPGPARTGSSRAATSRATTSTSATQQDEEHEDDDDDVDARLSDEMVLSDLVGAPSATQPTQATPPRRRRRDRADISSVNVVEGTRGEHPASRYTSGTGARRKRS